MFQREHPHEVAVCLPESFEWLLLASGVVKMEGLAEILSGPENYVLSEKFESWEQFFTAALRKATDGGTLSYKKGKLADGFMAPANADKVMALIAFRNVR